MAAPGLDAARHLPASAQRTYPAQFGAQFAPGGRGVLRKHLVTVLNSDKGYETSKFANVTVADRMFKRNPARAFRDENGVQLTRETVVDHTHDQVDKYSTMQKVGMVAGATVLGATAGYLLPFYLIGSAATAALAGLGTGATFATGIKTGFIPTVEDVETKEFKETEAIMDSGTLAIDVDADVAPGANYSIRTYNYHKSDAGAEKWSGMHEINIHMVNGKPQVQNTNFLKVNGGDGKRELTQAYTELFKTLQNLSYQLGEQFDTVSKAKEKLIKAETARPQNRADVRAAQAEFDREQDKYYALSKKFNILFNQVAMPLLKHINGINHNPTQNEKRVEGLRGLLKSVQEHVIRPEFSRTNTQYMDLDDYGTLLREDYASMIRFFEEEGRPISPEDKFKTLLPLVLKVEAEHANHTANINLDPALQAHLARDTAVVLDDHFRGITLAQLQHNINNPVGQPPLPPAQQVDFTGAGVVYLGGATHTYEPVLRAFAEEFFECQYNAVQGRMVPTRNAQGMRSPNLNGKLTELKDKYYYDHIPGELKTLLDDLYTAFKEYRQMVKEENLKRAAAAGKLPWYVRLGARMGFNFNQRTQEPENEALQLMMQMFGDPRRARPAPRRGRGPAIGGPPVAPVNANMAIIMAILNGF